MKILFSHQNFPAQFGGFGAWLAQQGWDVTFVTAAMSARPPAGCRMLTMTPHRPVTKGIHRYASPLENAMINGQAFANACVVARNAGYTPDVVVAHSGWGSGTFAKTIWPDCKYVSYVEWYYRFPPADMEGMPQILSVEDGRAMALGRNAPTLLDLAEADLVWCPTQFQADQFPDKFRQRIVVIPDGTNTDLLCPRPSMTLDLVENPLPPGAQIVTYATRGMEPHRGFPEFMAAIARLQKTHPRLHAVIGGEDRVCYGPRPPDGTSWKQKMLADLDLDRSRLHFVGPLPYRTYVQFLQASHLHVYLTVPFVLSWSLIEAMSVGCPLVTSDTVPLREVLQDGVSARMVNHRNIDALAKAISDMLADPALGKTMGQAARDTVLGRYDANLIWPQRAKMLRELVAGHPATAVA